MPGFGWRSVMLLALGACAGAPERDSASVAQLVASELLPLMGRDRRRCDVRSVASLPPESLAVRCAESFVVRNGYTDVPPPDTSEMVGESLEFRLSARDKLADRQGTLRRRAVVFCRGDRGRPGYTIGFAAPGDSVMELGRAVTMDTLFGSLVVQHQMFVVARALRDTTECRPVGARRRTEP
jgi:hypothetical protein